VQFQLAAVIADRLGKLLLAGDAQGEVKVAADIRLRLEDRDPVPARRRGTRKGEARRPAPTTAMRCGSAVGW
jgi:hypothetical protein